MRHRWCTEESVLDMYKYHEVTTKKEGIKHVRNWSMTLDDVSTKAAYSFTGGGETDRAQGEASAGTVPVTPKFEVQGVLKSATNA